MFYGVFREGWVAVVCYVLSYKRGAQPRNKQSSEEAFWTEISNRLRLSHTDFFSRQNLQLIGAQHIFAQTNQVLLRSRVCTGNTGDDLCSLRTPRKRVWVNTMQVVLEADGDEWGNALIQTLLQLRAVQMVLKFHESVSIIFSSHTFIRP